MIDDRYIGPYEILERIGPVAYRLALPPSLAGVHDVFHVSLLRKCLADADAVVDSHQPVVRPNLTCAEKPVEVLDHKEKVLRTKTIKYVKVRWSGQTEREATWELKDAMRQKYLFSINLVSFEDETIRVSYEFYNCLCSGNTKIKTPIPVSMYFDWINLKGEPNHYLMRIRFCLFDPDL